MAPRCFNNLKKAATSLPKSLLTQDFWAACGIEQLAQQRNTFHNIPVVLHGISGISGISGIT